MKLKSYLILFIGTIFFFIDCTKVDYEGPSLYDDSGFENLLVTDFEDGLPIGALKWYQSGTNMTFDTASDNPYEGDKYFQMGGRVNWDYLLGYIDIPFQMPNVNTLSENLFFNMAVLSGVSGEFDSDQFINVFISESDIPFNDDLSNNGSEVFNDSLEVYKYQIKPIDWVGWNMISVTYDMFEIKGSPGGNNIKEPKNIRAIRIQCRSCKVNNGDCSSNSPVDVRTDIDHIIFTENKALLD